jgi:hypothetical protein
VPAPAFSLLGFCFLCQIKSHLNRCIDVSPPMKGGEDYLVTTDSHEGRPVSPRWGRPPEREGSDR